MGLFDKFLRAGEGRKVKALADLVPDINALEPAMQALSDSDLQGKTAEFRQRLDNGEPLDELLIESFAATREAANRVIGQRHYDVQLMGGAALHFGWVAEQKTGEGKTLVSTLPVYLNGLTGEGVHVITVNDYLARRDAEWMGRVHWWMGLSIGIILPDEWDWEFKRAQYACDITYGTNNEFGFDYLRDNMAMSLEEKVQRGHAYAIVDEVDSILVDEARTPLIISGQVSDAAKLYRRFAGIVRGLKRDVDYDVDEEKRTVAPTDSGVERVEAALGVENMYDDVSANLVHQLTVALKAKELFHRDKDYLVSDGEVKIVDEFTGRVLEGRRWSDGLHQAVEAKEGVGIKEENQTLATITLQNYFRLYEKLAGMTGTAVTEAAEFMSTYDLQVVPIPTHRDLVRLDQADQIYKSEDGKFGAVVDDIAERSETGQPVLVGTISVEKSEKLGRLLEKRGIRHEVLNAKQHTREAEIVAQAGRLGAVTVATNMAGRGVDILLGGYPEGLADRDVIGEGLDLESDEGKARYDEVFAKHQDDCKAEGQKVRELGGLYVLGTERHESRRIDNQLRGRSGRQGDPGESRFYLSLEDELMRLFATGAIQAVMGKGWPDDMPIESKMVSKAIERAQNTVEQRNAETRKNVLKYDEVMNEQRKVIYKLRDQVLEGSDLSGQVAEYLATSVDNAVSQNCAGDYVEEWDVDGLLTEVNTIWPTTVEADAITNSSGSDEVYDLLMSDATAYYAGREEELGAETLREIERQVMIGIIDQRWREHLREMDHLQEGIHLRGIGQKDPLTEWQREGFEMFEKLVANVGTEFVQYVMRVQVVVEEAKPAVERMTLTGPEDPSSAGPAGPAAGAATNGNGAVATDDPPEQMAPVVKSDVEKTGRNEPCPCGSGKKFKNCHGAAEMQDFSGALGDLARRVGDAEGYLRIAELRARRPQLETEMARPDLWDDQAAAQAVQREFAAVNDDITLYESLASRLEDAATLAEMAREEGDESQEPEIAVAIAELATELDELELRALFTGQYDELDAICEVNSGAGGTDAQDWAEMLLRMYTRWAERKGFEVELDEATAGTEAGLSSATFIIKGRYAYGFLRSEHGVHRLVRISPFDNNARRQTSFASIHVTPLIDDVDDQIEIDEKDLRIDTYRSSGAGGQHVNVTDSAVRITHLPTGLVSSCQNERSQHQNKDRAMTVLKAKLLELERQKHREKLASITGEQQAVDFGSQIRSYVLQPYQQVKDLRSNVEIGHVEGVLDGDLDDLMEGYLRWERATASS